jgi:tagatose 1,6-diphosphate aldolase
MSKKSISKFFHLNKLCNEKKQFQMLAIDQRPPIFNIISNSKNRNPTYKEVVECKKIICSNLSQLSSAVLMDPYYSIPTILNANNSKSLIVTLEDHNFIESKKGRYSKNINNWTVEKIKKIGGDAVKVLVWYRPDAEKKSLNHQKKYIKRIGNDCEKYGIPFLLELLVYPFKNDLHHTKAYKEQKGKNAKHVINSVKEFAKKKYKVDIFKLESPVESFNLENEINNETRKAFKELANATNNIPWVMLSAGMKQKSFYNCLKLAYENGASGYLAGRTIWLDSFKNYPKIKKIESVLQKNAFNYLKKINDLTKRYAVPMTNYFKNNFKLKKPENFTRDYKGF